MPKRGHSRNSEWVDSKTAASELGITADWLRKLRAAGSFRLGYHYRLINRKGHEGSPRYRWHVDRCAAALETPLEERE